jgi:hypothetical protein
MIFFGAESGSDWVLKEMKQLTTVKPSNLWRVFVSLELSRIFLCRQSQDPERDTRECLDFIRHIKQVNPAAEIILQHYIPVPQREKMYGDVEEKIEFPNTPEEWATPRWLNFTLRLSPEVAWLPSHLKELIDNFELVVNSRWPTIQDIRLPRWGKALLH